MRVGDLIVGFFRADTPRREVEPYRRAAVDCYSLLDEVAQGTWARLAAWNAYLLQVYGDELVAAGSTRRYVMTDIATFALRLYEQASVWLEQTRKAQASDGYRFVFHFPHPLPQWMDFMHTNEQLAGMRSALDTGRTRTASDLKAFTGEQPQQALLNVRLAEVDAQIAYVNGLWSDKPANDLRVAIGGTLIEALDNVYALGQLLSQPELLRQLS